MTDIDMKDQTSLYKFIAYLAELANGGGGSWGQIACRLFQAGIAMPMNAELTDGRIREYPAAAAIMMMETAEINISTVNEQWYFEVLNGNDRLVGAAGDWALPFLVMYRLRGLASWPLELFLGTITRVTDHKLREFALQSPCKTNLPLTDLISIFTEKEDLLIGSHSGFYPHKFTQLEMRPVCEMAMSTGFESTWQAGSSNLLLTSEFVQHNLKLEAIPLPILASLVWRELHMPD